MLAGKHFAGEIIAAVSRVKVSADGHSVESHAQCDGTVRAVLQPSITWADLIAAARIDPRIAIAAADPDLDAAIAKVLAILTRLGARARVDVEVALAPDELTFGLRGILGEPVMTPEVADNLTATLQSSGGSEWTLGRLELPAGAR